jgi:tripartite ATP-independent transporter DctP family solute receptor
MSRRFSHPGLTFFAVLTLILAFAMAAPAQVNWKLTHKMPPESAEGKAFQRFADIVKEKSGGKMTVKIFPAEQLGKTEATLEMLENGTVQVYPEGETYLQKYVDELKFTNAPFLFESREQYARFIGSPRVKGWTEKVRKERNIMIVGNVADFVRGPYRVMVCKKPITSLADVNGLKLRLHPDDLNIAVWRELGANTLVLAWTEIYESLDRGIIEATNSPMALVEPMKFYETAKYIIRHDEFPQGLVFMTNAKDYEKLTPELQKVVTDAVKGAGDYSAELMEKQAQDSIARMEKRGVKCSVVDKKPFVEKIAKLYAKMEADGKMPKGLLAEIQALAKK